VCVCVCVCVCKMCVREYSMRVERVEHGMTSDAQKNEDRVSKKKSTV